MAESALIELNQRDELTDIVRKVNTNFKNLAYAQTSKVNQVARTPNPTLEKEIQELSKDTLDGFNQVNRELQSLTEQIAQLKTDLTPPVGTMMFCSVNPGNTYTGTTWTQMTQGSALLSSGAAYAVNTKWKLADSTLSSGGSLFIAYPLWKRTK